MGYAENPLGSRHSALSLTTTLLPEQALDLRLVWLWTGEPFAAIGVGDWRFAIDLGE